MRTANIFERLVPPQFKQAESTPKCYHGGAVTCVRALRCGAVPCVRSLHCGAVTCVESLYTVFIVCYFQIR